MEHQVKTIIHPEYAASSVRCACGNAWETKATVSEIRVETCSRCHPVYTGEARTVRSTGRVERFRRRYGAGETN
jgi:large subunit ribosomal protein L31